MYDHSIDGQLARLAPGDPEEAEVQQEKLEHRAGRKRRRADPPDQAADPDRAARLAALGRRELSRGQISHLQQSGIRTVAPNGAFYNLFRECWHDTTLPGRFDSVRTWARYILECRRRWMMAHVRGDERIASGSKRTMPRPTCGFTPAEEWPPSHFLTPPAGYAQEMLHLVMFMTLQEMTGSSDHAHDHTLAWEMVLWALSMACTDEGVQLWHGSWPGAPGPYSWPPPPPRS